MNVYIQELKMSARSAAYWTLGMLVLLLMFMQMFPAFSKDAAVMQQIISKFPPEFAKALGLSTLDLSNVMGYYGFLFTYMLLIGGIFAMKSGISVLSEEVRAKTADFLVVKPITRTAIVTAKLFSVLTNIVLQNIVYTSLAFIVIESISKEPYDLKVFFLINLSLLLVQLFFASLGLFVGVAMKKIKTVLPVALGMVFGFFVLQLLNQSLTDAKLGYITPFAYYDIAYIIETVSYKPEFFIINCFLVIGFTAAAYLIYNKKDMPSV